MDAAEYEKARVRMCRTMILEEGGCPACPLYNALRHRCGISVSVTENMNDDTITSNISIVEQWAKAHPVKTRKSEFLKMFPNADIDCILPCDLDKTLRKGHCIDDYSGCMYCKTDYWEKEVSE